VNRRLARLRTAFVPARRPDPKPRQAAREACVVIGGGISGLATAALLARDGHAVTLLEQQHGLGGRAGRWSSGGFTFDTGPSWYLMPEVIDHWFKMMGTSAAAELDLVPLTPAYRLWGGKGGGPVDVHTGRQQSVDLFNAMDPGSGQALAEYLASAEQTYSLARKHFLYDSFGTFRGLLSPAVLRHARSLATLLGASLDSFVAHRFDHPLQRQILGYPAVFLGTSPYQAPAIYHLMSHLDLQDGVLYPRGGFSAVVDAMERLARRAGVTIVTGARATQIVTGPAGSRARCEAVAWTAADGADHRTAARIVVGAADLHHVETGLLPENLRTRSPRAWQRTDPGISAVLVCLGIRGKLPGLAHHNLLFTKDWQENFTRIRDGADLSRETSLYVCRPSATDSTVAPDGCENLFVLVPSPAVPGWGSGGDDGGGSPMVEKVADAAIAQIAEWSGIADLKDRIVVRRTIGPADFERSVNAWQGSALGAAHTLVQSAFLRPGNTNAKVDGLFYAGSSVRPGIGVPLCMISGELVLKAVRGDHSPGPLPEPVVAAGATAPETVAQARMGGTP
jgi:1-hydroxy-2-isopentenylcarotenoid 3,4-desaturase